MSGEVVRTRVRVLGERAAALFHGLLAVLTLALAPTFLSEHYGAPAMLMALLLGMAFHFLAVEGRCVAGIDFAAGQVLRLAVALLGARITAAQVAALGLETAAVVCAGVAATILFGWFLARRLGADPHFGLLTGGATAICGASAALAISSVLPPYPQRERDTMFAVIGVTSLSTLAMVIYPVVVVVVGLDERDAGILIGATIHDVAQVIGAGYSISAEAGDAAAITKLMRVALLVPAVVVIALLFRARGGAPGSKAPWSRLPVPGFLIGFVVLVALNSWGGLAEPLRLGLADVSRWGIVMAVAAIGMKTSLKSLVDVGGRAVGIIFAEAVFLLCIVMAVLVLW